MRNLWSVFLASSTTITAATYSSLSRGAAAFGGAAARETFLAAKSADNAGGNDAGSSADNAGGNDDAGSSTCSPSFDGLTTTAELPPLVLIGDYELMSPCEPMELSSSSLSELNAQLAMLKQCQKRYGGIGIAACQVGWRARVFCMGIDGDDTAAKARYPNADDFPYQFWINPTVQPIVLDDDDEGTSSCSSWFWEGCLSVPGMRGWVERPNSVLISGWNEQGQYITNQVLTGLPARVAQHECDHLDGILFPHRAVPGTLLPVAAFDDRKQERWPRDWPTPGARQTKPGAFSNVQ